VGERRVALSGAGVPHGIIERAREFAEGSLTPTVPRDAATVILVRQAPADVGIEAFLLQRTRALRFAPGAFVYPGGAVDERDADPAIGWAGPSPADFSDRLGTSAGHARALVCAAVRETFEESGILLAGPSPTALLDDSGSLARDRRALLDGSVALGELLGRRGLVLRADLLTPWARWITPEFEPRRFDTWFFVAALPPGQTATVQAEADPSQPVPGESESGTWLRPSAALDAARAGEIRLLPPTAVTLSELNAHQDVASLLGARRTIAPLMPEVIIDDGQTWLAMPPAVEYPL
jgi:8-oxo-dGTP pyrophosphatase MutT (NUDIX family)